jgi:hypothetical protein
MDRFYVKPMAFQKSCRLLTYFLKYQYFFSGIFGGNNDVLPGWLLSQVSGTEQRRYDRKKAPCRP